MRLAVLPLTLTISAIITAAGCLSTPGSRLASTADLAPCTKEDPATNALVYGRVASTDGKPIPNATITATGQPADERFLPPLDWLNLRKTTDAEGCYRFVLQPDSHEWNPRSGDRPAGQDSTPLNYTLHVRALNYHDATRTVTSLNPNGILSLDITPDAL